MKNMKQNNLNDLRQGCCGAWHDNVSSDFYTYNTEMPVDAVGQKLNVFHMPFHNNILTSPNKDN